MAATDPESGSQVAASRANPFASASGPSWPSERESALSSGLDGQGTETTQSESEGFELDGGDSGPREDKEQVRLPASSYEESRKLDKVGPQLADLRTQLARAEAIQRGAENLLHQVGAGQGQPNGGSGGGVDTERAELQATVEAELDLANANVRGLLKQIEQLEARLAASSPRKGRRRLPAPNRTGTPSPHITIQDLPSESAARSARESFRELLDSLEGPQASGERLDTLRRAIGLVQRHARLRYESEMSTVLEIVLPCLSDAVTTETRCATYCLLRHLVVDLRDVTELCDASIELFLVKSLGRDHRFDGEKQHALSLLRTMLGTPMATRVVASSTVRAVVAIAETSEDKMRHICVETLAELLIRDIGLLSEAEGIRIVMLSLADGPSEFGTALAAVIMAVVDRPEARRYLRPSIDFEIALAGITDGAPSSHSQDEKVRASARIVTILLRSWTGLFYLCLNQKRSIRTFVETLKVPSDHVRSILLEAMFEIFQIKASTLFGSFMAGKRLTYLRHAHAHPNAPPGSDAADSTEKAAPERMTLVQHYLAILLLVFFDAGLLETLVIIAEDTRSTSIARKASLLIAEILDLSRQILPLQSGGQVQSLPRLFGLAASFDSGHDRLVATTALRAVDSLQRTKARLAVKPVMLEPRTRSNSVEDPIRNGARHVDNTRIRLGMQIDDVSFRNLVMETQVLVTKDHTKWSVDRLVELVEGPLLNPKRLEEVTKSTKLMRRLLGFFHPLEGRYPYIKKTKHSSRWTQLACSTLTSLLNDPAGLRFLIEDKLVDQIGTCLRQLDPHNHIPPGELLFSRQNFEDTLTCGYFEMIGVLSRHPEGLKLMEKAKMFTTFYALCEMRSREDLVKAVIENIDYEIPGHSRVVLSKALTSSYKHVRLYATHHLEKLIRDSTGARAWRIRLLLTQLYDPSPEVCALAVDILEEACESMEVLEIAVKLRPSLENLGEVGAPLLLRFLSTSVGARYLNEIDWTSREMEDWFHERNYDYVVQVETYLAKALDADSTRDDEDEEALSSVDGTPPPHFYGELVKTVEGQELLAEKGHFSEFADFIRRHGLEERDPDVIAKLKSILWAVGHIGASQGGLPFLEAEGTVGDIVAIAEESQVFSVRGTCYYVLGLIASTTQGPELLIDCGWIAALTPLGNSTGICVPRDINAFICIPAWEPIERPPPTLLGLPPVEDPVQKQVLTGLANLSNHLLANNASRTLARLRAKHREAFREPALFYRALQMLGGYRYRLATRRYIFDLFGEIILDPSSAEALRRAGEACRSGNSLHEGKPLFLDLRGLSHRSSTKGMLLNGKREIPSGSALLEAYDKTDYLSDTEDEEAGIPGIRRGPRQQPPKEKLEPVLTIKGFLL